MDAAHVPLPALGRPRWRSYLLLSRVSNLPTVWTNVLAGMVASSAVLESPAFLWLAAAASCFYTGGMFLNDAFDASFDSRARPERPIPSGDVSRARVFAIGGALLIGGELLLIPRVGAMAFGVALAGAILVYDFRHKGNAVAPIVMGACRGLVYCVAAAATGEVTTTVVTGAIAMTAYVAALTVVATMAGANARWLVPVLIAGISIVDAIFIAAVSSSMPLALVSASGFALTLFLQRYVPGD